MNQKCTAFNIRCFLEKRASWFDDLLGVLSILAIALVASGELVTPDWHVPIINSSWPEVQVILRTGIWLFFIAHFTLYMVFTKTRFQWMRRHLLELISCVPWVPQYNHGMFNHMADLIAFSRVVPLDVMQLVGTLAHAWRVLRWTARRFSAHPFFVTGCAAMLLIASSAAILQHLEPQTFPSFWDAVWYAFASVTTLGYGDFVPHTMAARFVSMLSTIGGIGIGGVFFGYVSVFVRKIIFKHEHELDKEDTTVREELARNNELLEKILGEMSTNNTLMRQLLDRDAASHLPAPGEDKAKAEVAENGDAKQ